MLKARLRYSPLEALGRMRIWNLRMASQYLTTARVSLSTREFLLSNGSQRVSNCQC